ncbi:MAG TPA: VWA domain-containing protein, partial [Pirellula sp.]|nr:VWA domain-containing protein [Pirellula sp.]
HPVKSRWAVLANSIRLFFDEVALSPPQPRSSLVTWASHYQMPISPNTDFPESRIDVSLPSAANFNFNSNKQSIIGAVDAKGVVPMMGGTNLSAGLTQAVSVFQGTNANAFSSKVIILLTDGQWNEGADPIGIANTAHDAGIIVHCVSMLTNEQTSLQQIAALTGGRYYSTLNEVELRAAFQELARSLPAVLTD